MSSGTKPLFFLADSGTAAAVLFPTLSARCLALPWYLAAGRLHGPFTSLRMTIHETYD